MGHVTQKDRPWVFHSVKPVDAATLGPPPTPLAGDSSPRKAITRKADSLGRYRSPARLEAAATAGSAPGGPEDARVRDRRGADGRGRHRRGAYRGGSPRVARERVTTWTAPHPRRPARGQAPIPAPDY